jgi:hypothetical protein
MIMDASSRELRRLLSNSASLRYYFLLFMRYFSLQVLRPFPGAALSIRWDEIRPQSYFVYRAKCFQHLSWS